MQSIRHFYMITTTIPRFDQFDKFLRIFDECVKNEPDIIFQAISEYWKTYVTDDVEQLHVSIKNISKDRLSEIIKNNTLLGSVN